MPRLSGPLLAVLSGLLTALAFPLGAPLPVDTGDGWWPLAWIGLAPLIVSSVRARGRASAAALGAMAGLATFVPLLAWLIPFLSRWGGLPALLSAGVELLLSIYIAAYVSAFALFVRVVSARWGPAAALLMAPAAWTGLELVRGRLLAGFPWGLIGYSQSGVTPVIQVAELAGVYGVSFLLVASSALIASFLMEGRRDTRMPVIRGALAAVLLVGLAYGGLRAPNESQDDGLPVALVQGNVPQSEKWDPKERSRIERDHFRMTREAAGRGARLVVWSESSVPASLTADLHYAARVEALARELDVELVVGSVAYRDGVPFNSAFLVDPIHGMADRYDKRRLVPFGEFVPLGRLLHFIDPLVEEAGDFRPGRSADPLRARAAGLGTFICYEAIFPELVRRSVTRGGTLLVNLTNDAWYAGTAMPRQHLAHAVLRAVESRRYLLRCANTGISTVVAPSGRIAARAEYGETTLLEHRVGESEVMTLYAVAGDSFAIACAIITILTFLCATARPPGDEHVRRHPQPR